MQPKDPVVAIACADIHLSLHPPVARAGEPDWFKAMERPWAEVREVQEKYKCPVLCSGDVFHHWKSTPELINWALEHLPDFIAIPGQHDLPFHSLELIKKSAYWTLVEAGKIQDLPPGEDSLNAGGFVLSSFPWGTPLTPGNQPEGKKLRIALVHAYTWDAPGTGYQGAPKEAQVQPKQFEGYDTVIIGDNHKSWDVKFVPGPYVFNCGGFMRRASDEAHHRPRVGLVHRSGEVESYYLSTTDEVFVPQPEKEKAESQELTSFLEELKALQATELNFDIALRKVICKYDVSSSVRRILIEALEHGQS